MIKSNPDDKKLEVSIANFTDAQTHPDANDLESAKSFAKRILEQF